MFYTDVTFATPTLWRSLHATPTHVCVTYRNANSHLRYLSQRQLIDASRLFRRAMRDIQLIYISRFCASTIGFS